MTLGSWDVARERQFIAFSVPTILTCVQFIGLTRNQRHSDERGFAGMFGQVSISIVQGAVIER